MKIIQKIGFKALEHRKYIFLFICTIIISLFTFYNISINEEFINILNSINENNKGETIFNIKIALIYISLIIVNSFLNHLLSIKQKKYSSKINICCEKKLNDYAKNINYQYFLDYNTLNNLYLAQSNIGSVSDNLIYKSVDILRSFFQFIIYFILLSKINVIFAFILIPILICYGYISYKASDKINFNNKEFDLIRKRKNYISTITKNIFAYQDIFVNNSLKYIEKKLDKTEKEYVKLGKKNTNFQYKYIIFPDIFYGIISAIIILMTIYNIINQKLELGYIGTILSLIFWLRSSIIEFTFSMSDYRVNKEYINKINEVLEYRQDIFEDNKNSFSYIELKGICYKYPNVENYVLKNIDLIIKKGEKIAIVGENGSGKTTLANILCGIYDNFIGKIIVVSDKEIYDQKFLRSVTNIVTQDVFYIQSKLIDNINLYKNDYSDERIMKNLENVKLSDKIQSLTNCLNTEIGNINENGQSLSMGEWQKISIVRSLLDDKSQIYILDEPTSSMNPKDEIEFYRNFYEEKSDSTIIAISHRLGFTKKADKIIVLNNGEIVEIGTFNELYYKKGYFYKLFNIQKEEYD